MSREWLTSPQMLRRFPWKLYSYVFGAAALGWGVGVDMSGSIKGSLIALLIGFVLCLIGYFGMRPYMRESSASIDQEARARTQAVAGSDQFKEAASVRAHDFVESDQ